MAGVLPAAPDEERARGEGLDDRADLRLSDRRPVEGPSLARRDVSAGGGVRIRRVESAAKSGLVPVLDEEVTSQRRRGAVTRRWPLRGQTGSGARRGWPTSRLQAPAAMTTAPTATGPVGVLTPVTRPCWTVRPVTRRAGAIRAPSRRAWAARAQMVRRGST